jgi:hypothetical protein
VTSGVPQNLAGLILVVELWPVSLYDEEFVMPRCHRRLLYFERVIAMGAMPA